MHYGIMGRFHVSKRLHLTAELSGLTAFRNFDGIGESNKFGDNMLGLSIGASVTIGKAGWKRVIDATPYISQNEWLRDYALELRKENHELSLMHNTDLRTIDELKKILGIEGLLERYHNVFDSYSGQSLERKAYPKNDYSGLNSLRARMNNRKWDGSSAVDQAGFLTDSLAFSELFPFADLRFLAHHFFCLFSSHCVS